jgi:uncharacterized protein YacL
MLPRVAVRGIVSGVAVVLVAAAAGHFPLAGALGLAALAAVAFAGEALIAVLEGRPSSAPRSAAHGREALVDTSALIDGRLSDVVESGFLDFDLVVPEFVLRELQHVADAPEAMRRARGRRGLDVLAALRASRKVALRVIADDVPAEQEVDLKLVGLAVRRKAALITTDFNLNKVAGIRGLTVLNVNDLAHALRPVVLPGEAMRVAVVKEGKEPGQGVGYLDDGTMVVVDHGRAVVGQTVDVVVTSAIQTAAGKMFFAKLAEPDGGR